MEALYHFFGLVTQGIPANKESPILMVRRDVNNGPHRVHGFKFDMILFQQPCIAHQYFLTLIGAGDAPSCDLGIRS